MYCTYLIAVGSITLVSTTKPLSCGVHNFSSRQQPCKLLLRSLGCNLRDTNLVQIDWEKVAVDMSLKSAGVAKVRYGQIKDKLKSIGEGTANPIPASRNKRKAEEAESPAGEEKPKRAKAAKITIKKKEELDLKFKKDLDVTARAGLVAMDPYIKNELLGDEYSYLSSDQHHNPSSLGAHCSSSDAMATYRSIYEEAPSHGHGFHTAAEDNRLSVGNFHQSSTAGGAGFHSNDQEFEFIHHYPADIETFNGGVHIKPKK
jgi:hypothetical protein